MSLPAASPLAEAACTSFSLLFFPLTGPILSGDCATSTQLWLETKAEGSWLFVDMKKMQSKEEKEKGYTKQPVAALLMACEDRQGWGWEWGRFRPGSQDVGWTCPSARETKNAIRRLSRHLSDLSETDRQTNSSIKQAGVWLQASETSHATHTDAHLKLVVKPCLEKTNAYIVRINLRALEAIGGLPWCREFGLF